MISSNTVKLPSKPPANNVGETGIRVEFHHAANACGGTAVQQVDCGRQVLQVR